MKIIEDYREFINEARLSEMRIGNYVLCDSNFRNISTVKGLYARITGSNMKLNDKGVRKTYFTLEFETPLIDKRTGVEIETNSIEISSSQIANLKSFKDEEYLRIKDGHILSFQCSSLFGRILNSSTIKNSYGYGDVSFRPKYKTYDISYFDIEGESITYLPANKASIVPDNEKYTSKQRQSSKIGRVLKKLNDKFSEKEIEDFSFKFKSIHKLLTENIEERLKVVTGDAIVFWYNESNYLKGGGTLNSSCMRGADKKIRLSLYSKYPDKIALCILLDENKKLCARALIWKLDDGLVFMDRIYYVSAMHELILLDYANKHNMKTKYHNYNGANKLKVSIEINDKDWENRPYLDTFKYYNFNKKILNNFNLQ